MQARENELDDGARALKAHDIALTLSRFREHGFPAITVGILLLGAASLINAVDDWVDSRNAQERITHLNYVIDCKADIASEISNLESERTGMLARGLVATVEDDEEALRTEINNIRSIESDLEQARNRRANASEICGYAVEDP